MAGEVGAAGMAEEPEVAAAKVRLGLVVGPSSVWSSVPVRSCRQAAVADEVEELCAGSKASVPAPVPGSPSRRW